MNKENSMSDTKKKNCSCLYGRSCFSCIILLLLL